MNHHAVCYVGRSLAEAEQPEIFLNEADRVCIDCHEFGIQEARDLKRRAMLRPTESEGQTFTLVTNTITHEAQNALLKLFEEPPAATSFYLVIPRQGILLPTLASRLHFIEVQTKSVDETETFIDFSAASVAQRLEMIAAWSKEKNIEQMESVVAGTERVAVTTGNGTLVQTVAYVRQYFGTRGASNKMLLELLALAIPTT